MNKAKYPKELAERVDDEPIFTFRAKDDLAWAVVRHYRHMLAAHGVPEDDPAILSIVEWLERAQQYG